jgi:hypothetical protein
MRCLLAAAFLAGVLSTGCGLVDPDITNFDLQIQDKMFTVDTEQWQLQGVDQLTSMSCATTPGVCAVAAEQACTEGQCFGRCASDSQTCELLVVVTLWQMVDTDAENPELEAVADQPVVDVTIDSIAYQVITNTLNVETPTFTIYAAPSTIMSPGDPEAREVGTITPVAPATLVPETDVVITGDGREVLSDFMGDYMNPFNIIVGAEVVVGMGDTVPSGELSAVVRVRAHAGL